MCLAVLVLYGITWYVTYTSDLEKLIDRFRRYCYAEYEVRLAKTSIARLKTEFRRDQYAEQLRAFTSELFGYRNKEAVQRYFLSMTYYYDVSETEKDNSYLLAPIVGSRNYQVEIPEPVSFVYALLGEEESSINSLSTTRGPGHLYSYQKGMVRCIFIRMRSLRFCVGHSMYCGVSVLVRLTTSKSIGSHTTSTRISQQSVKRSSSRGR